MDEKVSHSNLFKRGLRPKNYGEHVKQCQK